MHSRYQLSIFNRLFNPLFRTFEQIEKDPSRGSTEGTEREIGWDRGSWTRKKEPIGGQPATMIEVAQLNRAFRDGCNWRARTTQREREKLSLETIWRFSSPIRSRRRFSAVDAEKYQRFDPCSQRFQTVRIAQSVIMTGSWLAGREYFN